MRSLLVGCALLVAGCRSLLGIETPVPEDACAPTPELCGDGIDQDCDGQDPSCPANDAPGGAIDITQGGTFTATLVYAHADDQAGGACSVLGGRDVYYEVSLQQADVYYFDTFGSDFATTIRVSPGTSCLGVDKPAPTCGAASCSTPQTQLGVELPRGTSCVVVAQASASETAGALVLHVAPGGRDTGALISPDGAGNAVATANTCNAMTSVKTTCGIGPNQDLSAFFTVCPGGATIDVTCCNTIFDTVVFVQDVGGQELACDYSSASAATCATVADSDLKGQVLTGPALYYVGVTWSGMGLPPNCGDAELDVHFH